MVKMSEDYIKHARNTSRTLPHLSLTLCATSLLHSLPRCLSLSLPWCSADVGLRSDAGPASCGSAVVSSPAPGQEHGGSCYGRQQICEHEPNALRCPPPSGSAGGPRLPLRARSRQCKAADRRLVLLFFHFHHR
jgi:hypothetical protein